MIKLKEYFNRIVKWQQTPTSPPEMSEEECICKNCGYTFRANYCPRCGQNANTPRLGSRSAFGIFIDTWGFGRSGMLRNIWQLLARPGYMIGDYIDGHRQFYFPPFKTLLIVAAVFAIIFALAGGFSEEAQNHKVKNDTIERIKAHLDKIEYGIGSAETLNIELGDTDEERNIKIQLKNDAKRLGRLVKIYMDWKDNNKVTDQMMSHLLFALLAMIIFRKAPRRPKMNLAENIIAQVYICSQMGIIAIFIMLMSLPFTKYPSGDIPGSLSLLLFCYDYKQLFGYGVWRTILKTCLMFLLYGIITFIFVGVVLFGVLIHSIVVS